MKMMLMGAWGVKKKMMMKITIIMLPAWSGCANATVWLPKQLRAIAARALGPPRAASECAELDCSGQVSGQVSECRNGSGDAGTNNVDARRTTQDDGAPVAARSGRRPDVLRLGFEPRDRADG